MKTFANVQFGFQAWKLQYKFIIFYFFITVMVCIQFIIKLLRINSQKCSSPNLLFSGPVPLVFTYIQHTYNTCCLLQTKFVVCYIQNLLSVTYNTCCLLHTTLVVCYIQHFFSVTYNTCCLFSKFMFIVRIFCSTSLIN